MAKKLDDKTLLAYCLSGKTQTVIAKELHMSKTQICKRINAPEFQELLTEFRNKVLDGCLTELTASTQKAVHVLVELLDDENPYIRLKSAGQIIALAQDYGIQKDLLNDIEIWRQTNENEAVFNRLK